MGGRELIRLLPLTPDAVSQLLRDLLGDDPSLKSLLGDIAERAQGNPFFLEELVRSVVDRGKFEGEAGKYYLASNVDTIPLPATVQAVIAARIDRLPEPVKQALQTAAVTG